MIWRMPAWNRSCWDLWRNGTIPMMALIHSVQLQPGPVLPLVAVTR
jgi:hypothetical protein